MKPVNIRAAYHSPCHLERMGGVIYTINLLRKIPGLDLVILHSECCGIAGTYGFKREYYAVSQEIGSGLFKEHRPGRSGVRDQRLRDLQNADRDEHRIRGAAPGERAGAGAEKLILHNSGSHPHNAGGSLTATAHTQTLYVNYAIHSPPIQYPSKPKPRAHTPLLRQPGNEPLTKENIQKKYFRQQPQMSNFEKMFISTTSSREPQTHFCRAGCCHFLSFQGRTLPNSG
jgi:hypothetical protein